MDMHAEAAHEPAQTEVLIVGGSLVGLSVAMFLGWHGVSTLNVERHQGTAIHPRAGHFHLRTLEALRSVDVETKVRNASLEQFPPDGGINAVESLSGREIASYIANLNAGVEQFSPSSRLFLTQQRLEPILREHAESFGAKMQYATELVSFEQDADGVTAQVRDINSGALRGVRAKYLVAADGNRSPIREQLGIAMQGHGLLSKSMTIYFRAPLCVELLRDRNLGVIYVINEDLRGFFRFEKGGETGFLVVMSLGDATRPGALDASADISLARCQFLVRSAIGNAHAEVEIIDVAPWLAVADVAERYRAGGVFLIGDAAHVVPPTGGFGGNTGIQDAHNLAWKLAMVLKGQAGEGLLDSYDAERQPVGAATIEQAYVRYVKRVVPHLDRPDLHPLQDDLTAEIGYQYRSSAVIVEQDAQAALYQNPRHTVAGPGARAAHVMLQRGGESISTLDLFGRGFVLLAAADGAPWCAAVQQAAFQLNLPLNAFRIAPDGDLSDPHGLFLSAYGLTPTGAALVRPDGFMAWRSVGAAEDPDGLLASVLAALTCREIAVAVGT